MLDFLFKKRSRATNAVPSPAPKDEPSAADLKAIKKQTELQLAESFADQEDAALNFILHSNFADARLAAFRHIQSPDYLRQISQTLRNTDRRVSKLAQEKLAELDYQKKMGLAAQACLLKGQSLLQATQLMANQVTAWEKERQSLGDFGSGLLNTKLELENRLHVQVDLQRDVMQLMTQLRSVVDSLIAPDSLQEKIAECERQWTQIRSHTLIESLPVGQLAQLDTELARAQAYVARASDVSARLAERSAALLQWDTAESVDLQNVRTAWLHLSVDGSSLNAYQLLEVSRQQEQFDTLLNRKSEIRSVPDVKAKHKVDPDPDLTQTDIAALLQSMESALEEGALHQALELDKSLRSSNSPMPKDQAQRLTVIRAELNRLLDWAKWGGDVSRQELVNVADGLLHSDHAPTEIAKQVGGLRARWKELDRTSGGADKVLWSRFDSACTRAYAIADSYFKQQTQLRQENLQLARQTLAEMEKELAGPDDLIVDLKARQTYIGVVKNTWRKIGPIDRKFKSSLEQEFAQKLSELNRPLQAAQESAIQSRRQLIQSILAITPQDRDAVVKVKEAQQRWQQQSSAVMLDRKADQDLWRQFRTACDAIFEQRQANTQQQQQAREQMKLAGQACCERLESAGELTSAELSSTIHAARQEWRNLGGQNRDLDARFNSAINALVHRQAELIRTGKQTDLSNLREKIELCQKLEAACRSENSLSDDQHTAVCKQWQKQWDDLGRLSSLNVAGHLNKLMSQRFQSALGLLSNRRVMDAGMDLEQSKQWEEHALRIEITRNLPSPPELLRQRMQLQVSELQLAMKNRSVSENYLTNFYALCTLPVPLAEQDRGRLQRILGDCLDSGSID